MEIWLALAASALFLLLCLRILAPKKGYAKRLADDFFVGFMISIFSVLAFFLAWRETSVIFLAAAIIAFSFSLTLFVSLGRDLRFFREERRKEFFALSDPWSSPGFSQIFPDK